jgi:hypothetical protein
MIADVGAKRPILPWILFTVFEIGAFVLAVWAEPVRHWALILLTIPALITSPLLLPWLLYSLYVIWRDPERRNRQEKRVGYVLTVIAALSMALVSLQFARGAYAGRILRAVESYKAQHGRYPEALEQVGFKTHNENGQDMGTDWWGIAYADGSIGGLSPAVFYPGPLPFSMNTYEFDKGRWTYFVD